MTSFTLCTVAAAEVAAAEVSFFKKGERIEDISDFPVEMVPKIEAKFEEWRLQSNEGIF